jgi:hypothetical protein
MPVKKGVYQRIGLFAATAVAQLYDFHANTPA